MTTTTPPEPTVLDAAYEAHSKRLDPWWRDRMRAAVEALGLDPAGSVARLREALAVYERAMQTEYSPTSDDFGYQAGFNDCRNFIVGDAGRAGGAG